MLTSLAKMRDQLQELVGAKVSDDEALDLLNEGYVKLVCESDFNRATITIPVVAGQEEYTLDDSIYRVLKVYVSGYRYLPGDEETVKRFKNGELWLTADGVFYPKFDSSANEALGIYPAFEKGDIEITAVVRPALLTSDSSVPTACPPEFRRGIVEYAAALALSGLEDDAEQFQGHMSEFERYRQGLEALRNTRMGDGPRQVRVIGEHY